MTNRKIKMQKWNDEACAAACDEMKRMRSLLEELEKEMSRRNSQMNTDGRSVTWATVGDIVRTNEILTHALSTTGNESDTMMHACIELNLKF